MEQAQESENAAEILHRNLARIKLEADAQKRRHAVGDKVTIRFLDDYQPQGTVLEVHEHATYGTSYWTLWKHRDGRWKVMKIVAARITAAKVGAKKKGKA